jgi:hypothetical protein
MLELPFSIDLKKTHICLQTFYIYCLLFTMFTNPLWLLPTICNTLGKPSQHYVLFVATTHPLGLLFIILIYFANFNLQV